MDSTEFELTQNEELSIIPKEFHVFCKNIAWEQGHSCGYQEVLGILVELVAGIRGAILELEKRGIYIE